MYVRLSYSWLVGLCASLVFTAKLTTGFQTLCYWTVWSQGRSGDYGLKPGDIDPYLCTHLIYSFGAVGPGLTIDLESNIFPAARSSLATLTNLKTKNPDLVVLISLGGSSKGPEAFLLPAATESSRNTFAQNVLRFCRQSNLDGVDIDWEYPENGTSFTLLIQAVRNAFDAESVPTGKKRLLLTAAVSVAAQKISSLYNIPALNRALDFFNVMAYDFHGSWGKIAGFNSPLYSRLSDPRFEPSLSGDWAIKEYIKRGASPSKLILGLASYGRAFHLVDRTDHRVGAHIERSRVSGPVLQDPEYRMYPAICDFFDAKRARYHYDEEQQSAFVYTIDFWIGFDDTRAFQAKTKYAVDKGLGGVLLWTLDYDDVSGKHCNLGAFPLTKAVKHTISGKTNLIPQKPVQLYQPDLKLPQTTRSNDRYKRVCYFTNWSAKRNADEGQFTLDNINLEICTHLSYAFAFVDEVGMSVMPIYEDDESSSNLPNGKGMFEKFNSLKKYKPALNTLLSVGGVTAGITPFDIISKTDKSRRAFSRNLVEYLDVWGFNGVDISWQIPGFPITTKRQYTLLLQALREEFDNYQTRIGLLEPFILSVSVSAQTLQIKNAYEIPNMSQYVDFINILSFDYHRTDNVTYFNSPLRRSNTDPATTELNQAWSVDQWIKGGAPPNKLLLGLTGLGRSFTLTSADQNTPGSPFVNQDFRGPILGENGVMLHYEACDFLSNGATEKWDQGQIAAYAYLDKVWVSYENTKSITAKVLWLISRGLGGYMFWSLDYDDYTGNHCNCGRFPLLTAAYEATRQRNFLCPGDVVSHAHDTTTSLTIDHATTQRPVARTTPAVPKIPTKAPVDPETKPPVRTLIVRDSSTNVSPMPLTIVISMVILQIVNLHR